MLRWVLGGLILANLLMFAAIHGAFGPAPAAGPLEPDRVQAQVHPERVAIRALP
jgi:hypothetical protein